MRAINEGLFLTLVTTVFLSGCAELEAQRQAQANAQATIAATQQAARDDAQCRSYGAQPGSDAYVQCRSNLDNQHTQDIRQRRAMAAQILFGR